MACLWIHLNFWQDHVLCNVNILFLPFQCIWLIYICIIFLLWLHPFILSGVISPLISSSILGTYRPGEFLFQYPIIFPFHGVHGVLKARVLKWCAIPFSSGPSVKNKSYYKTNKSEGENKLCPSYIYFLGMVLGCR